MYDARICPYIILSSSYSQRSSAARYCIVCKYPKDDGIWHGVVLVSYYQHCLSIEERNRRNFRVERDRSDRKMCIVRHGEDTNKKWWQTFHLKCKNIFLPVFVWRCMCCICTCTYTPDVITRRQEIPVQTFMEVLTRPSVNILHEKVACNMTQSKWENTIFLHHFTLLRLFGTCCKCCCSHFVVLFFVRCNLTEYLRKKYCDSCSMHIFHKLFDISVM